MQDPYLLPYFEIENNKNSKNFKEPKNCLNIVKGLSASYGKVSGKAKIILLRKDYFKIKAGDIIVSTMTTPDIVPLIGKIKGIITDEGGLTCHAAIIAREINIPCIVGTKNATKTFSDGDLILLDTKTGTAKKQSKTF